MSQIIPSHLLNYPRRLNYKRRKIKYVWTCCDYVHHERIYVDYCKGG